MSAKMFRYINQLTMILKSCSTSRLKILEIVQHVQRANFVTKTYSGRSAQSRADKRLQRLLEKKKYRYSFDAVSHTQLGSMVNQPSMNRKGAKVMGPEESVKLKTYNTIIHEHVDEIISSNIISQELQDLQVSIIGVRLTGDMSTCRIYWQASGNHEEDQKIQNVLDSHAPKIRHALINHRVLGKIPQIAFLQERTAAMKAEVERLLQLADIPAAGDADDNPEEIPNMLESSSEDTSNQPVGQEFVLTNNVEQVLGLDQSRIQNQIKLLKLQAQRQNFTGTTEGSIEQFRSTVKRRKKARDKGLYDTGNYRKDRLHGIDESNNDFDDADDFEENDERRK